MPRLLEATLPNSRRAAGEARRLVAHIDARLPDQVLADVELLVSELVTNSHRYGGLEEGDRIQVTLSQDGNTIRGEIVDPGKGESVPAVRTPTAGGGWGLEIVQRRASRWGVDQREEETVVWFEIEVDGEDDE